MFLVACAMGPKLIDRADAAATQVWRGVHIMTPPPSGFPLLKRTIAEVLAPMGVNVIVFEVGYHFEFQSDPDLRGSSPISKADARDLADLCRKYSIRLIPEFNCLGHQSWGTITYPLLIKYPEMDETPDIPFNNPGIYCRSWCPLHPRVNEIVFKLIDELIDAFQADAFHVGMDEVFLIASEQCPRCRGKDPAQLFAKAVNDYHRRLVDEKGLTMLMWGDRLLDNSAMRYGEWESSANGTAPAIDQIPKDIVLCDWHYGVLDNYPSIPYFLEKGFRVWPTSWRNTQAAEALLDFAQHHATDRMIGHLCTTWGSAEDLCRALLGEGDLSAIAPQTIQAAAALRLCMKKLPNARAGIREWSTKNIRN